jgi:hypothetical protein
LNPVHFRILGLPYEILEFPPVFHPSRANGFSEFSEKCWKMCGKILSIYSLKEIKKIIEKS